MVTQAIKIGTRIDRYMNMSTNNSMNKSRLRSCFSVVVNIFTFFVLMAFIGVVCLFSIIFINPYSGINPFPPPTVQATAALPTATPTSIIVLPPTWTATQTIQPTSTNTPIPLSTQTSTPTQFVFSPTPSATFTVPPEGYPFQVRQGSPQAIPNIYHPELDCQWMGVGGQAVDLSGGSVTGLIIRLGGSLPGVNLPDDMISLTGVALNYGRGGYEFTLADRPIASNGTLWLQLLEQSGIPLSDKVYFDTYDSCDQNLIIIDFKQVR